MIHAVRPSFGATTTTSSAAEPQSADTGAGTNDAGDVIESLLADEDVKKALDSFKRRITEPDSEAPEAKEGDGKAEPKKTFFQTIKPWLSLLGTLAVAVLGVIFGKRGGVALRP